MSRVLCSLGVALALATLSPTMASAQPTYTGYRMYVRVERPMPDGTLKVLREASASGPAHDVHVASSTTMQGYVEKVSQGPDNVTNITPGMMNTGVDASYVVKNGPRGTLKVPVTAFFSEPYTPDMIRGLGYRVENNMATWCPVGAVDCVQLPMVDQVELDQTLDMTPGKDMNVQSHDSQGPLRFVFHLEPTDPV